MAYLTGNRKVFDQLDMPQIVDAVRLARWIKFVVCVSVALSLAYGFLVAEVELINSGASVELTPQ